ncbi:MAG: sugar nucleotide-binding protein [bacterium]|nr:sugar nucleotide-binding protein [bacterium]
MKSILIFGKGQLGTAYRQYFENKPEKFKVFVAQNVDVRDFEHVRKIIQEQKPEAVLNAVAKTNIDWCEQNREECFAVNTLGADNIAAACQEIGIYLVHLSTGCIQESKTAQEMHREEDPVNPLCFYSWTKIWAEQMLNDRSTHRGSGSRMPLPIKTLILRPRQLLSSIVSPRNALTKMLTYSKFIDTPNSCTIVDDLLWVTERLMDQGATGIYNVINPGVITPLEIAWILKEMLQLDMEITKISKEELDRMTLAKRIDSVLSGKKLAAEGIELPEIHVRLREIITVFKKNLEESSAQGVVQKVTEETKQKLSLAK